MSDCSKHGTHSVLQLSPVVLNSAVWNTETCIVSQLLLRAVNRLLCGAVSHTSPTHLAHRHTNWQPCHLGDINLYRVILLPALLLYPVWHSWTHLFSLLVWTHTVIHYWKNKKKTSPLCIFSMSKVSHWSFRGKCQIYSFILADFQLQCRSSDGFGLAACCCSVDTVPLAGV